MNVREFVFSMLLKFFLKNHYEIRCRSRCLCIHINEIISDFFDIRIKTADQFQIY